MPVSQVELATRADHHGFHLIGMGVRLVFAGVAVGLQRIGVGLDRFGLVLAVALANLVEQLLPVFGETFELVIDLIETDHRLGRVQLFEADLNDVSGLGTGKSKGLSAGQCQQQRQAAGLNAHGSRLLLS